MIVPGTDGQKMSKSYNNYVDIFQGDKPLRKQVMKIVTDSKELEESKDPDSCNVYNIYKLMASEDQIADMRAKYEGGNYGYGHAKQELFELLVSKFSEQRETFQYYMNNKQLLDDQLAIGAEKARATIRKVLDKVRPKLGY